MYYLCDFAEFTQASFGFGRAMLAHPGKTMAIAAGVGGGIGLGASYLNKKDKRTLKQRTTDTAKVIVPAAAIMGAAHSKHTGRMLEKLGNKYGRKGVIGGTLGASGLIVGGGIAAQQMRKRHAENTRKNRKKGQRLKDVNVNMLGLKYKDYASNLVY